MIDGESICHCLIRHSGVDTRAERIAMAASDMHGACNVSHYQPRDGRLVMSNGLREADCTIIE
jgi:hypothetical protein